MSAVASGSLHVDPRLAEAGFVAGVTTRAMGNMADVANRSRALELAGLGHLPAYDHKQVHGRTIEDVALATSERKEADGWVVAGGGRVAEIYAADCMPIFVWDKNGKAAAVLHSGWKGTQANIAAAGVSELVSRGIAARDCGAYIGAHIGPCCYAVGEDFAKIFRAQSLERRTGKLYLDLGAEARAQLAAAGVPPEAIAEDKACTGCSGQFFSYRREKSGTRMMAFLAKRHG